MTKSLKLFLDSRGCGGIETHVLVLAKLLKQQQCDVEVVFWQHYGDHPLYAQLQSAGVPYQCLRGHFSELLYLARSKPNAVLHCHGYKANLLGRLTKILCGNRVVCTYHNGDLGHGKLRWYTWLDEFSSFCSLNIAVSADIAKRLHQQCVLIRNTVEMPQLEPHDFTRQRQIAFVGRLAPEKRPDRFLKLASHWPDVPFGMWGDGPLTKQVQQQGLANVSRYGAVASMDNSWSHIELLVICSDFEGLPMVALEAMARGIPVLATAVGDLPNLILHKVTGFICQTDEQLQAELGCWLAMSPAQKQQMSSLARQHIQTHYSSQTVWPRLIKLYFEGDFNELNPSQFN